MQNVVVSAARPVELDFDSLVGPHLEAGYRTALAILRDPDEAHDAVQEAAFRPGAGCGSCAAKPRPGPGS